MQGNAPKEQGIMTTQASVTEKPFQFEEALAKLESLVDKLGKGQLSLEEALASFEQGVVLAGQCQAVLKEAEQKVKMLVDYQNPTQTVPFDGAS